MRSYLIIISLFLINTAWCQSGVQFTNPIVVADGSIYGYTKPKIVLDYYNNPVVLWGKTSTHQIFVSKANSGVFGTPVQINPVGTHPYISSFYNADIKSSGDTIMAVFATDVPANRTYIVRSLGGSFWMDTVRVDQLPAGGIAYFPSLDLSGNGKVAVTFMRHEAGWVNPRFVVATSTDWGSTFSPDTNASAVAPGEVCDCCPAELIYEGDQQVLIFRNNNSNVREFYASVSNDNGNSFTGLNIDNLSWNYPACPSVAPSAFISGDTLITVFMNGITGGNRLYISTNSLSSMTNGNLFPIDTVVPPGTQQTAPQIAGKDSVMAMVWSNTIPGAADVYFRFSSSGPLGLVGDGINISNPTTGTQQNADIAYANGVFHIVYQNSATQEVYYLKAIMDEYIGINEQPEIKYSLHQNNGIYAVQLMEGHNASGSYQLYDIAGRKLISDESHDGIFSFDMNVFAHGVYWIHLEGLNRVIKFNW